MEKSLFNCCVNDKLQPSRVWNKSVPEVPLIWFYQEEISAFSAIQAVIPPTNTCITTLSTCLLPYLQCCRQLLPLGKRETRESLLCAALAVRRQHSRGRSSCFPSTLRQPFLLGTGLLMPVHIGFGTEKFTCISLPLKNTTLENLVKFPASPIWLHHIEYYYYILKLMW